MFTNGNDTKSKSYLKGGSFFDRRIGDTVWDP
jgi:hypothetical protein